MSYILDALKKSERQRPPGPVPDLFTMQGPQAPDPGRRPAVALAVALATGCVVLLGIWAWFGGGGRRGEDAQPAAVADRPSPAAASRENAAAAPQRVALSPTAAGVAGKGTAASRPVPARMAASSVTPTGRRAASPPPVPAVVLPAPAPLPAEAPIAPPPAGESALLTSTAQTAAPDPSAETSAPVVPPTVPAAPVPIEPVPEPEPMAVSAMPSDVEPLPVAASTAPSAAPDGPPEVPPPGVVDLAALPPSVRGELPALGITGHVWSEEAALRLLTVQDRIVREGGEAAPGVRLEEVTQSGAVFVFRGWRFSVASD